ncbi:hypothetical protein [uncultured Lamprocystis sp.]|jgi:hypothetical protein|uniref:hypothetical protein n=1 Tax=uncultured Lamprocystis sp. TaxID=543132 RepID=UPI0025EF2977|nr:hypothetical protein [uncultured Lamprocystis sp.]
MRNIVEDVLTKERTKRLWTTNYFPALPITPQDFDIGAVLPTMLYLARFGHRRGKGKFVSTFGQSTTGGLKAPTVSDVAERLTARHTTQIQGFDDEIGKAVLSDLLLSRCLENRKHAQGHHEQVQRIFPTHYFASWIDLPEQSVNLRNVPELLTALLASQPVGESLDPLGVGPFPVGVADLAQNRLLALFGRHCAIRGPHAANLASDVFLEDIAEDIGIDELLAIRIANACGNAPDSAGKDNNIPNRHPLASLAAGALQEDLAVFISAYGRAIPRHAFLQMLEAGIGLGLLNLLLSTAHIVNDWEHTGEVIAGALQTGLPLFVDASQGQNGTLRELSEASLTECLRRYDRLPVGMMLLRVLDEAVASDPDLKDALPQGHPAPSDRVGFLGDILHERHPDARLIRRDLDRDCQRLADSLERNDFAENVVTILRSKDRNAAVRLAEALCDLMGDRQQAAKFRLALDSALLTDKSNGLAVRRRVSRTVDGRRRSLDVRSIVLSSATLDFLVHRHLRDGVDGESSCPLTLHHFLDLLRDRYGLFVDQEPPGQLIPRELLLKNKAWLERRLRDLGLLIGVNDAESMKQLRPRYQGVASHVD